MNKLTQNGKQIIAYYFCIVCRRRSLKERLRKKKDRMKEMMASFREDEASYDVAGQEEAELKKLILQAEAENGEHYK
jgi:hypothetical protein